MDQMRVALGDRDTDKASVLHNVVKATVLAAREHPQIKAYDLASIGVGALEKGGLGVRCLSGKEPAPGEVRPYFDQMVASLLKILERY